MDGADVEGLPFSAAEVWPELDGKRFRWSVLSSPKTTPPAASRTKTIASGRKPINP